eukprot:tig00000241_g21051.t1
MTALPAILQADVLRAVASPLREGPLAMRSRRGWRRVHVVLKNKSLFVFPGTQDLRGLAEQIIALDECPFVMAVDELVYKRAHVFVVTDREKRKTFTFAAESEDEWREWNRDLILESVRDGPPSKYFAPKGQPAQPKPLSLSASAAPDQRPEARYDSEAGLAPSLAPPAPSSTPLGSSPMLGPAQAPGRAFVEHLVLVVHGVGSQLDHARLLHHVEELRRSSEAVMTGAFPDVDFRVEFAEIEWHSSLRGIQGCDERIAAITPGTLPKLRSFLNDKVLDVCYFLTPRYHKFILEEVAAQLNHRYKQFILANPRFSGKVSVLAHSLGGVVSYDILTNQRPSGAGLAPGEVDPEYVNLADYSIRLDFAPAHLFLLGCPLGVFLSLRGETFHAERLPFRLHNIFHPYDCVAFRLEPLVDPSFTEEPPVPVENWARMSLVGRMDYSRIAQRVGSFFASAAASAAAAAASAAAAATAAASGTLRKRPWRERRVEACTPFYDADAILRGPRPRPRPPSWGGFRIDYALGAPDAYTSYFSLLDSHFVYWSSKESMLHVLASLVTSQPPGPAPMTPSGASPPMPPSPLLAPTPRSAGPSPVKNTAPSNPAGAAPPAASRAPLVAPLRSAFTLTPNPPPGVASGDKKRT